MSTRYTSFSMGSDALAAYQRCELLLQRDTLSDTARELVGIVADSLLRFKEEVVTQRYPMLSPYAHAMLMLGRLIDSISRHNLLWVSDVAEASCELARELTREDRAHAFDVRLIDAFAAPFVG